MMNDRLKKIVDYFYNELGLKVVIGAEIEFYLADIDKTEQIMTELASSNVGFIDMQREEGERQYEIKLKHIDDPLLLAKNIEKSKKIISSIDEQANFTAVPFDKMPGSALHIQVNLFDKNGRNIFTKPNEDESIFLKYSIAGLLEMLPASLKHFISSNKDLKRYSNQYDKYSPKTISWGGNNRTVAIRLPSTTLNPESRRIEHRVPSANSNPEKVIFLSLIHI